MVATTKALARAATARKRGPRVVVNPGLDDRELQVRTRDCLVPEVLGFSGSKNFVFLGPLSK